jgi:hypothetical protein
MNAPMIITTVTSESRKDIGYREIFLVNGAPRFTYTHTRYRFRNAESRTEERTWEPEVVKIKWREGQLSTFGVRGHRVKKDGTVGLLGEAIDYHWDEDEGTWLGREDYTNEKTEAPDWLLQLVDSHKDNPPNFDAR